MPPKRTPATRNRRISPSQADSDSHHSSRSSSPDSEYQTPVVTRKQVPPVTARKPAAVRKATSAATAQLAQTARDIDSIQRRIAELEATVAAQGTVGEEQDAFEDTYQQASYVDCVPILSEGVQRIPTEEAPEWYQKLFPEEQTTWNFPPSAPKTGHLWQGYDPVLLDLQSKAAEVKGELRSTYEAQISEWRVLRQSILYTHLIGGALFQLNSAISEYNIPAGDLPQVLAHLEQIAANLVSDQLKRASVILFASKHTGQGAKKLVEATEESAVGYHPDLIKRVRELADPKKKKFDSESEASESSTSTSQPAKKHGSSTWRPAASPSSPSKQQDGPAANVSKSPSKQSSPRKPWGGKGG